MPNYIENDTIMLVERTHDCDGSGWRFAHLTLPDTLIGAYVKARSDWEQLTAEGYNKLMDIWAIPADVRIPFVNEGAFDRSVAAMPEVMMAVMAVHDATQAIVDYIGKHEIKTYGIPLDECDLVSNQDFNARYLPLIHAADMANSRAENDPFSHANRLVTHYYTSIFNRPMKDTFWWLDEDERKKILSSPRPAKTEPAKHTGVYATVIVGIIMMTVVLIVGLWPVAVAVLFICIGIGTYNDEKRRDYYYWRHYKHWK